MFRTEEEAHEDFRESILINGWVDFNDKTCDEDRCAGWDGEDRRCDCGNRRVSLLVEQGRDGQWRWYAQAY